MNPIRIFARRAEEKMPPSIDEIASGVRLKNAHRLAEEDLADLRQRRERLRETFLATMAKLPPYATEGDKAKLSRRFEDDDFELAKKLRAARSAIVPLREAQAVRVSEALHDRRVAACERIVSAIDELGLAVQEFNEIAAAMRRWGADEPSLLLPALQPVRRRAAGEP